MNLASRSKLSLALTGAALAFFLLAPGVSYTLQNEQLVEDFTTATYADTANSTGIWNDIDHMAQAGIFANSDASRPLDFGDGSDGALSTAGGYTFDTDSHPNGYNFTVVNITAGTITVTGSKPLVIRSQSTINIASSISVSGSTGADGANDATTTGPSGGSALTSQAKGAAGGAANASSASSGGDGFEFNGTTEAGTGGAQASDPVNSTTGPGAPSNFDTSGQFIAGTGGGGGGGASQGGHFATGGAGGAGGGTVHIASLGNLTVGNISANGGNGGKGGAVGAACAGNGSGGNGGAIWLQTYHTLTKGTITVTGGSGPSNGCNLGFVSGVNGTSRGDAATGAFNGFSTANALTGKTYVIQSKAYDLNTPNASFPSDPVVTSVANGGSVSLAYAGSIDGTTFTKFTNQLSDLSNQNYRYLKFQITLTTSASAAPSPNVSKVVINYVNLGLDSLNGKFAMGCGTLAKVGANAKRGSRSGPPGPGAPTGSFALEVLVLFLVTTGGLTLVTSTLSRTQTDRPAIG